jgi:predicted house-cleaning NTP pyrophosphatase (Maf/HAM1 superfamily)
MDKAGAYAIQHAGFHPAARWEGCYAGVVGFPLRDVAALLTSAGWPAFTQVGAICRGITGAVCCGGA